MCIMNYKIFICNKLKLIKYLMIGAVPSYFLYKLLKMFKVL